MTRLEDFAQLVHRKLADPSVALEVGKKKLAANAGARRIVWHRSQTPCRVQFADRRTGGQKFGTETLDAGAPPVSRELQTLDRIETAQVHVKAQDGDDLELLFDAFCKALELAAPGAISEREFAAGLPYSWTEDEFHGQRCPVIALDVSFRIPVATETKTLTIVRATTTTCTMLDTEEDA